MSEKKLKFLFCQTYALLLDLKSQERSNTFIATQFWFKI